MEKNTGIAVGLDIGTTKITVIVGQKNEHGKIEILGMGKAPSTGVMRGIVANIDKTTQSINKALEELVLKLVMIFIWMLKVQFLHYQITILNTCLLLVVTYKIPLIILQF